MLPDTVEINIVSNNKNERKKKGELVSVDEKRLREAFEIQRTEVGWTFYNERLFAENLLHARFNILITMYALFMTAIVLSKDSKPICLIGFVITTIMGFVVYRIYAKMMILLSILHKLGDNHVLPIQTKESDARHRFFSFPVNSLIGVYIPVLLSLSFVIVLVWFWCGHRFT